MAQKNTQKHTLEIQRIINGDKPSKEFVVLYAKDNINTKGLRWSTVLLHKTANYLMNFPIWREYAAMACGVRTRDHFWTGDLFYTSLTDTFSCNEHQI